MNSRSAFVRAFARQRHLTLATASELLHDAFFLAARLAAKNGRCDVPGFGRFVVTVSARREIGIPFTRKVVSLAPRPRIRLRPSRALRAFVERNARMPEKPAPEPGATPAPEVPRSV